MVRYIDTPKAPPPFSRYSQAVAVSADAELIFMSGQVGVDLDGKLAQGDLAQHQQTWRNILGLLDAEGLSPHDIVEITTYITNQDSVPICRQARDDVLDGAAPASTLLVVAGLADPAWTVEIAIIAAKPAN